MQVSNRRMRHNQKMQRWWEFQKLYHYLSSRHDSSSLSIQTQQSNRLNVQTLNTYHPLNHNLTTHYQWQNLKFYPRVYAENHHLLTRYNSAVFQAKKSHYYFFKPISTTYKPANAKANKPQSNALKYIAVNADKPKQQKPAIKIMYEHGSRQNQIKRQKEWVYLTHYIAISGLNPLHVISGEDDGREPDFTLIFYRQDRLYYVGVELTTLPRLKKQTLAHHLIAKRWYWQSLMVMAKQRQKKLSFKRFKLPVTTIYMPQTQYQQQFQSLPHSAITQKDINAVMQKKAHKVPAYHTRRPLDELWLLIHTDKYQPSCILTALPLHSLRSPLKHSSDFTQVQITRYPSHKIINVEKT